MQVGGSDRDRPRAALSRCVTNLCSARLDDGTLTGRGDRIRGRIKGRNDRNLRERFTHKDVVEGQRTARSTEEPIRGR